MEIKLAPTKKPDKGSGAKSTVKKQKSGTNREAQLKLNGDIENTINQFREDGAKTNDRMGLQTANPLDIEQDTTIGFFSHKIEEATQVVVSEV